MSGTWEELVAVALVGTERRRQLSAPVTAVLGSGLPPDLDTERRVLAAAGLLGAARRAGWMPPPGPAPPPPTDEERFAPAPPAAVQVLELLLSGAVAVPGGPDGLVADWLRRCADSERHVPPRLLTAVLDRATRTPDLRPDAARAVGERGRWLARGNPTWSWAVFVSADDDVEERWSTGSRADRSALLLALRRSAPQRARSLIESTFPSEDAADRAAFVHALATGLSEADEPFLESVLDDRAASVRAAAALVLDGLPSSRRAARMAARTLPLVRLSGRLRPQLEVTLPESVDDSARRDGIVDPGRGQRGHRSWWLMQIIGGTPLSAWCTHLGRPPDELVRLAGDQPELLKGWVIAAVRQRRPEWAAMLLPVRPGQTALLSVLPAAEGARVLVDLLARPRALPAPRLVALLDVCPTPWTPALSTAVVGRFRAARGRLGPLATALPRLAAALDPTAADEVERWIGELAEHEGLRRHVRQVHHALTLRRTIAEEFT